VAGKIGELVKGLSEKFGTGQSPMDPGVFSTAIGDRSDAGEGGHFVRVSKSFSICAHRHQEPGSQGWAGTRQAIEEFPFRMRLE